MTTKSRKHSDQVIDFVRMHLGIDVKPYQRLVLERMFPGELPKPPEPTCANCGLEMSDDNVFLVPSKLYNYIAWHKRCPPEEQWPKHAQRMTPLDMRHDWDERRPTLGLGPRFTTDAVRTRGDAP